MPSAFELLFSSTFSFKHARPPDSDTWLMYVFTLCFMHFRYYVTRVMILAVLLPLLNDVYNDEREKKYQAV